MRCRGCRDAVPGMQKCSAGIAKMQWQGCSDAVPGMQRCGAGVAEVQSWDAERQCRGCSDAVPGMQRGSARDAEVQCRRRSPTQPAAAGHQAAAPRRQGAICRVPVTGQRVPKPASTEPAAVPSQAGMCCLLCSPLSPSTCRRDNQERSQPGTGWVQGEVWCFRGARVGQGTAGSSDSAELSQGACGDSSESLGHLPMSLTARAPIFWQCCGDEDAKAVSFGFQAPSAGVEGELGLSYKINPGSRAVRWPCRGTSAAETERDREWARDEGDGMERYRGWRYPRASWHSALHHQAQTLPGAPRCSGQL